MSLVNNVEELFTVHYVFVSTLNCRITLEIVSKLKKREGGVCGGGRGGGG